MDKTEAIAKAGSGRKLARLLGITPQAISQWQDGPIPELQKYRLKELKPHWFRRKREVAAAI